MYLRSQMFPFVWQSVPDEGAAFRLGSFALPQTQGHQKNGCLYIAHSSAMPSSSFRLLAKTSLFHYIYIFKIDNSCHKKAPSSWPGFNKTQVTGAFSLLLKGEIKVVLVLCGTGKGRVSEHFRHKNQTLRIRPPHPAGVSSSTT